MKGRAVPYRQRLVTARETLSAKSLRSLTRDPFLPAVNCQAGDMKSMMVVDDVVGAPPPTPDVGPVATDRIMVKSQGQTLFVSVDEVDWIESDGNYLRVHMGERSHLVRGTISSWTERLDKQRFIRIHRRFLVNRDRIGEVQPWFAGDCIVYLHDGTKLRLSRTYREAFQEKMLGTPIKI